MAAKLLPEDLLAFSNDAIGVYQYASELSIFNLASSEYKKKHVVVERLVILTENDFYTKWTLPLLFPFDLDLAIVNQVMHTFTKQTGYMKNNITSETWSWHKESFD